MIEKLAQQMQPELVGMYQSLHKIPETGFHETETSAYIQAKLSEFGIPFVSCAKTGVVAQIVGEKPGKTVLLRADIDGLPVQEESGVPYASEKDGFMHACGHDVHVTCLLGAAKILNSMKSELSGTVKLVFQPAEESDGGALPMIDEGIMENPHVDAAFAFHVEPLADVGIIQLKHGPIMASPDDFEIVIKGVGGHGATPELCVNPITIGAKIIEKFEKIAAEYNEVEKKCVVSTCSIHAGSCNNAIPDTAVLIGTARSLDPVTRKNLAKDLEIAATELCVSMGAACDFQFRFLYPPLVNDAQMNQIVEECAESLESVKNIVWLEKPAMTGDDFSYFCERAPGSYFKVGVGNAKEGINHPIHSPFFRIDDRALPIGAAMMAEIAIKYLK